ncbi:MAG TPA: HIG1 domain-containing protein [Alteraurantiacibacter sp.]|jgi:hypothetical protein
MIYILIPVLLVLVGMTVFSLFRGLNAFRQEIDANTDPEGAHELQLRQNRMMWARIKYQAAAVVVVALLLAMSR